MLKMVGRSGQISLGKKYAGKYFEMEQQPGRRGPVAAHAGRPRRRGLGACAGHARTASPRR